MNSAHMPCQEFVGHSFGFYGACLAVEIDLFWQRSMLHAGSLFFWTFELLVFMVLLNFLLAIIVDAFSVVKDNTSESVGIHEELAQMVHEKWRSMLGRMLNVHYLPTSRVSALLKHWAGSDLADLKAKQSSNDKGQKRIKVTVYSSLQIVISA
jgi:hypothetical protein